MGATSVTPEGGGRQQEFPGEDSFGVRGGAVACGREVGLPWQLTRVLPGASGEEHPCQANTTSMDTGPSGARALPVASTLLHYERGAEGDLAPERLHARGPTSRARSLRWGRRAPDPKRLAGG